MLSAVLGASAYRKSISCCPCATSWCAASTSKPIRSSTSTIARRASSPRSAGARSKYEPTSCVVVEGSSSVLGLNMKNSASMPAFIVKPSLAARAIIFFRTPRGSPANGLPSGVLMSQMTLATRLSASPHGKIWKVLRSGARSMSDSSIRTNPSIEEPSNIMSPASAFSNCDAGTSTFLLMPRMSVNCSLRNRTLLADASSRISGAVAPAVSGTVERACRGIPGNLSLSP